MINLTCAKVFLPIVTKRVPSIIAGFFVSAKTLKKVVSSAENFYMQRCHIDNKAIATTILAKNKLVIFYWLFFEVTSMLEAVCVSDRY